MTCAHDEMETLIAVAAGMDVPAAMIGIVGAPHGQFVLRTARAAIDIAVEALHEVHSTAIPRLMERAV